MDCTSSCSSSTIMPTPTGTSDGGAHFDAPAISSVVPVCITLLAVAAVLIIACVVHRYRQKKMLTRRIRVTENKMNSIANDLKITKAAAAETQLNANMIIARDTKLQPLQTALAGIPPPPPLPPSSPLLAPTLPTTTVFNIQCIAVYTTTVETCNPSLQTVDNDESELSEEDYDTPTDVDTSEKEISYALDSCCQEQANAYSFFSTPKRGRGFLSLQTIATFQNFNNCTLETHYSTTLSTGLIYPSPPHHSSVPQCFNISASEPPTAAVLVSDDMAISPSSHYHTVSDDRDTVTVPVNTPNNSLPCSRRRPQPPNDSTCSNNMTMSTTLTMYTCPSSPIGSNTCVGDDEQEMVNEDGEVESEYQTDAESWV